jgi:FkbM family methyltransferase
MGAPGVLARAWAWQVWRRAVRRPVVIRCAEGSLLIAQRDSRLAGVIASTGLTERDDALFLLDLLRPGDLFVDVGANIGFYTILAARRGARVLAYEPGPAAWESCRANIVLNDVEALATVHRAACAASPGVARFTVGLDIADHLIDGQEGGIEVPVTTLDAELSQEAAVTCSVFKIDAEKHDMDVLLGAMATLERLRPIVLVEVWMGGQDVRGLLEPLGYRPYSYDPGSRDLSPGHSPARNMLLIADAERAIVQERLATAERPVLRPASFKPWRGQARVRGGRSPRALPGRDRGTR